MPNHVEHLPDSQNWPNLWNGSFANQKGFAYCAKPVTRPSPGLSEPGPELTRAVFTFGQEGNTLGTTEQYEELDIILEFPEPNESPFYVLRTETGWSMSGMKELAQLIGRCRKIMSR